MSCDFQNHPLFSILEFLAAIWPMAVILLFQGLTTLPMEDGSIMLHNMLEKKYMVYNPNRSHMACILVWLMSRMCQAIGKNGRLLKIK